MAIHHDKSAYGKLENLKKDFSDKETEELVKFLNEDENSYDEDDSYDEENVPKKKEKKDDNKKK